MITLTVARHWTDGKKIHVIATGVLSGNYTTGGDTLSFNDAAIKSSRPPQLVSLFSNSDLSYKYWPGTTRDSGKLRITGVGGVQAVATVTSSGVNVTAADTITLGSVTYKFVAALTGSTNEVLRGASASATLDNLKSAVNAGVGKTVTYGAGTVANPDLSAGTKTNTTILFTAKGTAAGIGTSGNALVSTTTAATLSFGGATFATGTDADGTGAELAAGAYGTGMLAESINVYAIFPELR